MSAMTLHQPTASLLVYGFHCAEGRTWTTSFRGWLWIHAAAKEMPPAAHVRASEEAHVRRFTDCGVRRQLPQSYPRSALIGRVFVEDVVPQAELRRRVADGRLPRYYNNDPSPFVFVCTKFERLTFPFSMSGQHKIWNLPRGSVKGFERGLRPVPAPTPIGINIGHEAAIVTETRKGPIIYMDRTAYDDIRREDTEATLVAAAVELSLQDAVPPPRTSRSGPRPMNPSMNGPASSSTSSGNNSPSLPATNNRALCDTPRGSSGNTTTVLSASARKAQNVDLMRRLRSVLLPAQLAAFKRNAKRLRKHKGIARGPIALAAAAEAFCADAASAGVGPALLLEVVQLLPDADQRLAVQASIQRRRRTHA